MTEATTDLWTYQRNKSTSYTQWFWFYAGASPNTTYTDNFWSGIYDGIGACNIAISKVDKVPFKTEEARNAKVAEAHFLRAVYYFNAVEQFGGVTVLTEPTTEKNLSSGATEPMKIYEVSFFRIWNLLLNGYRLVMMRQLLLRLERLPLVFS